MTQPIAATKHPKYQAKRVKLWRHGYTGTITALGAMRRVQALRAIGWTVPALAEATGLSTAYLYQLSTGLRSQRINKRNAEAIDRAYRVLCVQPLHKGYGAKRARLAAKAAGWFPPMAWDDIDDPQERPTLHARRVGGKRRGGPEKQQQEAA